MHAMLPRRAFLKAGLVGTLSLTVAGGVYRALQPQAPAHFLSQDGPRAVLAAIVPVMLNDAIRPNAQDIDAAIQRIHHAVMGLSPATQNEIEDLFSLLLFSPARRLLTGLTNDWTHASAAQVEAFLNSWRYHRFQLMQSAYHALHDLIVSAWYADESTWASIGYPGPLKELR